VFTVAGTASGLPKVDIAAPALTGAASARTPTHRALARARRVRTEQVAGIRGVIYRRVGFHRRILDCVERERTAGPS
jgi:hypothetical protein